MWIGQKMAYERAEGDRGELVVSCRRYQLLDCRVKQQNTSQPPSRRGRKRIEEAWVEWIDTEQRKRLGLCIYVSLLGNYRRRSNPWFSYLIARLRLSSNVSLTSVKLRQSTPHCLAQKLSGMRVRPGGGKPCWGQLKFPQVHIS
jgi:hypothetical protein